MADNKEPMKKYQSLLSLKKDIESQTHFDDRSDNQSVDYAVAWWDSRGLWLTKSYLSETSAINFARWILRMTQEETYNNE